MPFHDGWCIGKIVNEKSVNASATISMLFSSVEKMTLFVFWQWIVHSEDGTSDV